MRKLFLSLIYSLLCFSVFSKDLPIFMENRGQWHENVKYKAQLKSGEWILHQQAFTFLLWDASECNHSHEVHCGQNEPYGLRVTQQPKEIPFQIYQQQFLFSSSSVKLIPENASSTLFNFYLGNDSRYWKSGVKSYSSILYENFYSGIDMRVHTTDEQLHYDWILKPNADIRQIRWKYDGLQPKMTSEGLFFETSFQTVLEKNPIAWQIINGKKRMVNIQFQKIGDEFFFQAENYDTSRELVIDPILIFSTLTGSTADNWGFTATDDLWGNAYSGGLVNGPGYPTTTTSFQPDYQGGFNNFGLPSLFYASDIAIIKYSPDGSQRVYATYIGGGNNDQPHSMITDSRGNLYILGATRSANFPVTPNAYQTTFGGVVDAVIVVLDSSGSALIGSTFIGGSSYDGVNTSELNNPLHFYYADDARGEIQLDKNGNIIFGSSTRSLDLPITLNAYQNSLQGVQDGMFGKFSPDLSTCYNLTFLGGNAFDAIYGIVVNDSNEVYFSGGTNSTNLGTSLNSVGPAFAGTVDGFVYKLDSTFSFLSAGSYIGTSAYDQCYLLHLDKSSNVYLTGQTSGNFPITSGVFSVANGGQFLMKLNPDLSSVIYSTRFGTGDGNPDLSISALLVDKCENVYISGWGGSLTSSNIAGMPTTADAFQPVSFDGQDFYLIVFQKNAASLAHATYFGGAQAQEHVDGGTSRYNTNGVIYQSVCADCNPSLADDFPVTPGAFSTVNGSSNCNNGLFKFDFLVSNAVVAQFTDDYQPSCSPVTVDFNNFSLNSTSVKWFFGTGDSSSVFSPSYTYTSPGTYTIQLIVTNPNSCNINDTISKTIVVQEKVFASFSDTCGMTKNFTANVAADYLWDFGDGNTSTLPNPVHTYADTGNYNVTLIINSNSACPDTVTQTVRAFPKGDANFTEVFDPCNLTVSFNGNVSANNYFYFWDFGDGNFSNLVNPTHTFPTNGVYTVKLIVNAGEDCASDTVEKVFQFVPKTVANFNFSPPSCDSTVVLSNLSSFATTYFWDFGDGNTDTIPSPTHAFPDTGNFLVTLITQPGSTCADTISLPIYIPPQPKSNPLILNNLCEKNISASHNSQNAGVIRWEISDGTVYLSDSFTHTFADTGNFSIRLITGTSTPCPDTSETTIYIRPVSIADAQVQVFQCDSLVQLTSTSLFSDNWVWDFGDGATSTDATPTHVYSDTGSFIIQLITMPGTACADTFSQTIQLFAKPNAAFSLIQQLCEKSIQFNNNSQHFTDIFWDFGDGNVSDLANPMHTFATFGTYNVSIIVGQQGTCFDTLRQEITISEPSEAVITSNPAACSKTVNFTQNSLRSQTYFWDFGDGSVSTLPNPTHTYPDTGTYTVQLITNRNTACADTTTSIITVTDPAPPVYVIEQEPCTGNLLFNLNAENLILALWDFGDGITSSSFNPTHFYGETSGNYTISLTVVDTNGCTIQTQEKYAWNPNASSYIYIPNVFTPNNDGINETFKIIGANPECVESVLIFDRWGRLLFSSDTYTKEWDGTFNGKPSPEGAYVYVVSGKRFKRFGTVTLVR